MRDRRRWQRQRDRRRLARALESFRPLPQQRRIRARWGLSQIFGDGKGDYPPGAYVDLFQTHNLTSMPQVEAIYEGLLDTDPKAERIGALAALLDYRDGTNRTGLNPKEEKLIRHIGISGHHSPPVMIECLQRDRRNIIDTLNHQVEIPLL